MKKRREVTLDQNLGYLLSRTASLLDLMFQRTINEKGYSVTVHQWRIMQKLYDSNGLSQVELGTLLDKNGPNITRILDIMEKNDLICRNTDPKDRRKFVIHLTAKGREMKEKIAPLSRSSREKAFKNISQKDLKKFRDLLNLICANMA
ncbi:MAG TPA: MarR family winged helix-turn-helix transcriptional regulator [Thermodesulfobacteriota bacterium]|nr:MarR family winged helix-turn-helix transcriptional regulator [Thermodesulfobacteriota bacterium]